jgi:hypothetical protein
MKKVSLLILLVVIFSTVLMAAVPTKMARLTIINKSDFDVYMQLTGSDVTEAFYYLTVPTGSRDEPTVKIFTVMQDVYSRQTWQCDGYLSTGQLVVSSNLRLTFTPCFQKLPTVTQDFYQKVWNPKIKDYEWVYYKSKTKTRAGEPTLEKVVAFRYFDGPKTPVWSDAHLYSGYWNWGCVTVYWRIRNYRRPDGCWFRYQY